MALVHGPLKIETIRIYGRGRAMRPHAATVCWSVRLPAKNNGQLPIWLGNWDFKLIGLRRRQLLALRRRCGKRLSIVFRITGVGEVTGGLYWKGDDGESEVSFVGTGPPQLDGKEIDAMIDAVIEIKRACDDPHAQEMSK